MFIRGYCWYYAYQRLMLILCLLGAADDTMFIKTLQRSLGSTHDGLWIRGSTDSDRFLLFTYFIQKNWCKAIVRVSDIFHDDFDSNTIGELHPWQIDPVEIHVQTRTRLSMSKKELCNNSAMEPLISTYRRQITIHSDYYHCLVWVRRCTTFFSLCSKLSSVRPEQAREASPHWILCVFFWKARIAF